MKTICLITTLFLVSLASMGQDTGETLPLEIVKYYFVELISNPDRPELPKAAVDSIQRAHMANISHMIEDRKLLLAGPFENGGGIFIFDVASLEEAEELAVNDPAVKAGRLLTEIRPWYTSKGAFTLESKPSENE
ncbi:MAG: YciI family protein [Bacteroidota bacterium]